MYILYKFNFVRTGIGLREFSTGYNAARMFFAFLTVSVTCLLNRSLLSRWTPRYFTVGSQEMSWLLILNAVVCFRPLLPNLIARVLFAFRVSFQSLSQGRVMLI